MIVNWSVFIRMLMMMCGVWMRVRRLVMMMHVSNL